MDYAELHCHSSFSLLDGASNPEELIERAKLIGLSAIALTDHDDMGGAVRFAQSAAEMQVSAIIGAELSLKGDYHITLLAKSLQGYKNICSLISRGRMSSSRGEPRVSLQDLSEHSDGVVALSGCPHGQIPSLIARGRTDEALGVCKLLLEIYGEDLFLELWDHNIAQESVICRHLYEIACRLKIPWVVTNNVHYAYPEKRIVHDVLTCLRHEVTLSEAGTRLRPNGSWYLKSAREMMWQWRRHPEGLRNTLIAAERCEFRLGLLKPRLPQISIESAGRYLSERAAGIAALHAQGLVKTVESGESESCEQPTSERLDSLRMNSLLRSLTWLGARERYGDCLTERQISQLKHELNLIERLDLSPYFLIMWDIVRFAESRGIAVQGRGSAANSAVCYCLRITAVDPIEMDLLFERFISEDRDEPPDIDLDIAHQEREKVLQYVYETYGREHAAMVCEQITYRGASAVRDLARVFEFSPEHADRLAAEAQYHEAGTAAEMLAAGGAARAGLDPSDRRVQSFIQAVAGLHQIPRHRSIHVGGFVLSGEPIGSLVPVEPASMPGRTVIQWDKDDLDYAGLIKIDLLGLGMLTMIQEGLRLIKKHRKIDLDLGRLDMSDDNVYGMMRKADTIGVFQIESRAQMSILPKIRPSCFFDIVVSIAIVRPGPIQGNIVHPYLRRRRGIEPVEYLHPCVEPILKRTLGVPLFQEQGMKLAVTAAGFTASQADQLRRVMSHKRSAERMAQVCVQLSDGMRKNGLSEKAIETITFQLKAFANYGFPESHAASFALLVFASAYIKFYYAPEFYCAILNAQPMGFYSPDTLIRDALRHAVEVRPVDLSRSFWDCTLEQDEEGSIPALRIGLRFVAGLGAGSKEKLEEAWQNGGAFKTLEDACRRSGLKKKDLERLAAAGAFESFYKGRRNAMWKVLKIAGARRELPLLDLLDKPDEEKTYLPPMSDMEQTVADYSLLGLSVGNHPMTYFRKFTRERNMLACGELSGREHGEAVRIAGCVICRQQPKTAKGFVFLTLEDETGTANVIINPQVFRDFKQIILSQNFIAVSGRLQLEEGVVNLIGRSFEALPRLSMDGDLKVKSRDFH